MSNSISLRLFCVIAVLGLLLSAEAKVVGHWRFSGTPGTAATVGTEFPNLVSGTGVGVAKVFNFDESKDTTNYTSYYTNAFDAPFTAVRASLTNETILASDITSAYTIQSPARNNSGKSYYDTAVGDRGFPIKIEDPNDKLKNPSFTIEMIVRDGSYNSGRVLCSMPGQGMDAFRMMGLAGTSCNAYIGVSNTVSNASRFDNTIGNGNQASFDTTRYHHVALVVDGVTHKAKLYRDGQIYRGAFVYGITSKTYSATDCINYMAGAPLIVGATMNDTRCCHNVQFEELRYSDEALSPEDFLRKAAPQIPDKSPLVYLPLDTDYVSLAYGDVLPEAVVAANVDAETGTTPETWTGNVPELVPDVWKPAVRDGHRAEIRKENLGSASFSTGSVYYADCPLLPNEPKITVEFFFKMDALNLAEKSSMELIGTRNFSNTTMNDGNGGGKPWYIYVDASARFCCGMYGAEKDQSVCTTGMRPALIDGNWHHFALTIDRNGEGQSVMTIYIDYEVSTSSNNPKVSGYPFTYSWNTTPLGICYGWQNAPAMKTFVGQLDEVRISKGVLAVEDFLKAGNPKRGLSVLFL